MGQNPPNASGHDPFQLSPQVQASYNQIYRGTTDQPLTVPHYRDENYFGDYRNPESVPNVEIKNLKALKLDIVFDKKSIQLKESTKFPGKYYVLFKFSCESDSKVNLFLFANEKIDEKTSITQEIKVPLSQSHYYGYQVFGKNVNFEFPKELFFVDFSAFPQRQSYNWPFLIQLENSTKTQRFFAYCVFGDQDGRKKINLQKLKYEIDGIATIADETYGLKGSKLSNSEYIVFLKKIKYIRDAVDCSICMSEKVDTIIKPCNHMCMCSICCKDFKFKSQKCPMCRTIIESYVVLQKMN